MKLRIVQWNIHLNSLAKETSEFLAAKIGTGQTLVCLEEVTPRRFRYLVTSLGPTSSCFSLNLHQPGGNEAKVGKLGIAMLGFGLKVGFPKLLGRCAFPERTLSARIDGTTGHFRIVAFHSLTSSNHQEHKPKNFALIADYLRRNRKKIDFLCCDANEPRHDSMDPAKLEFSPKYDKGEVKKAALIMGAEKVHELTDSYVDYLSSKGKVVTRDPLAVSYKTGTQGQKHGERRYDYIMHSPKWQVVKCAYPYDESVATHSDHSAVIADFELR
ncbi:hypothetical protein LLF88_07350 [bacterium]|nr:hypothetical protein [bacterium]